jgi:hypothetical protein
MNLRLIVIGDIFGKDSAQLCLPEHDHVVETFPSDRADQSLRVLILPDEPAAMGLSRMPMARNRRVTVAPKIPSRSGPGSVEPHSRGTLR